MTTNAEQEDEGGDAGEGDQADVDGAVQLAPLAAALALREMLLIVNAHLRRQP